jgi:hypothetical protein
LVGLRLLVGRWPAGGICGGTGTVRVRDWRLGVRVLDREGVTRAGGRGVAPILLGNGGRRVWLRGVETRVSRYRVGR